MGQRMISSEIMDDYKVKFEILIDWSEIEG